MRCVILLLACLAAPLAAQTNSAPSNGILLVAKPGMLDPNFRETVVVVARTPDASTIGVILNRPTSQRLAELVPGWEFAEPLHAGGPVMPQVVVALFAVAQAPQEAAFQVLPNVYLTMHPKNVEALLERRDARVRLFAGFSGWAARQLESEIDRGAWYALRASEAVLFRQDTSTLWGELVEQIRGARTANDSMTPVARR